MSPLAAQKRARLQTIVAERATWASQVTQITCMHGWVLEVEHLLDESLTPPGEVGSNVTGEGAWRGGANRWPSG